MQSVVVSKETPRYLVALSAMALIAALVSIGLLSLHLRSAAASATPLIIEMVDMPPTYQPAKLTIKVGETVEWKNTGTSVHHASSDPSSAVNPGDVSNPPGAKPFDSGFLQPGQSFTYTFTVPGRYKYICAPHETSGMAGEVVVK
jgi:plastocyanin